jgi:hypothetical protein
LVIENNFGLAQLALKRHAFSTWVNGVSQLSLNDGLLGVTMGFLVSSTTYWPKYRYLWFDVKENPSNDKLS